MRPAPSKSSRIASSGLSRFFASKLSNMPESIFRSAPPVKEPVLPEVMTTPLTAASATISSTMASNSPMTSWVKTFIERPGMSQVTRARPSPSISMVKFSLFINSLPDRTLAVYHFPCPARALPPAGV